MTAESAEFRPPRELKGRRERRIWRALAQELVAREQFNASRKPFLSVYAVLLARIERDPAGAAYHDLLRARALGKALGLSR